MGYNKNMGVGIFLTDYLRWHYGSAPRDLFLIWKNFLWFGYHFFSIGILSKTLFSPLYRIQEPYKRLAIEYNLESLIANLMMRIVGFIIRSVIISAGIIFELGLILMYIPLLVVWLLWPAVVLAVLVFGLFILF